MSGSNGFHPVINLNERQKCPKHPTKRKYTDGAEAGIAAQKRSKESKLDIVAYMCEACGHYHLTKNVGGDSVTLPDGKFTVGEFKQLAPSHPVFSGNPADEPPIVPGDHATRVKFTRRFLETNPEPTSEELCLALGGCTKDSLRKIMRELGYRNTRGRHARWVPGKSEAEERREAAEAAIEADVSRETSVDPEPDVEVRLRTDSEFHQPTVEDVRTPVDLSYDNDAPERPTTRWHGGRDEPWREARVIENVDRLRHMPLGDLLDTYAAAGMRLVLSLEDAHA
ncbi:helix-turn-helix DNA binding domain protein [Microbacterium phage ClearAsMud]|uniref:Helix-turn-helix DNA binding domain protein n=1 Tax=Microbacterium phage ClearAsMud TaxID=2743404 RepID=A0A7G9A0Z2_9CAUD|nr:helix-turn-helix DNA binding domain protein [Microbacterium phage ClearAsMud]QNL30281.1 helix-turn-helix DNA binding domain protein [Microbacterium phage ClearAsMud]